MGVCTEGRLGFGVAHVHIVLPVGIFGDCGGSTGELGAGGGASETRQMEFHASNAHWVLGSVYSFTAPFAGIWIVWCSGSCRSCRSCRLCRRYCWGFGCGETSPGDLLFAWTNSWKLVVVGCMSVCTSSGAEVAKEFISLRDFGIGVQCINESHCGNWKRWQNGCGVVLVEYRWVERPHQY